VNGLLRGLTFYSYRINCKVKESITLPCWRICSFPAVLYSRVYKERNWTCQARNSLERQNQLGLCRSWSGVKRHSSHQEANPLYCGSTGYVEYEGDFSPFAEPLDAMQKPHIGGTTSFGFGKIKIENAI